MNKKINVKETAKRMCQLKKENKLKICDIAEALCISESTVKNYLSGRTLPPIEILYNMVKIFNLEKIEEIIVFE